MKDAKLTLAIGRLLAVLMEVVDNNEATLIAFENKMRSEPHLLETLDQFLRLMRAAQKESA